MKRLLRLVPLLLAVLFAGAASAQAWPQKPLRLIVPFPPGGSNDVVARSVATQLSERIGQSIVIDNRGGAGGTIGIDAAAKSSPDGYTLLLISVSYPMNIALGRFAPDSMKAFVPVAALGSGPSVLVVPPQLGVESVKGLIALARQKPGALNMASAGIGSFQHLASELFRLQAGIDVVIVQYKGGGPALTDVLANQVQINMASAVQTLPHIRSGKLKVLGVGGARRIAALPDVPTVAEAGVPGYEAANWWAILAPAGTPEAIVQRLHAEISAVTATEEIRRRFELEGAEVMRISPAELGRLISFETEKWVRVVKEAKIKAE